jgi:hypothetical protein
VDFIGRTLMVVKKVVKRIAELGEPKVFTKIKHIEGARPVRQHRPGLDLDWLRAETQ